MTPEYEKCPSIAMYYVNLAEEETGWLSFVHVFSYDASRSVSNLDKIVKIGGEGGLLFKLVSSLLQLQLDPGLPLMLGRSSVTDSSAS
jgi:hypothetical protein